MWISYVEGAFDIIADGVDHVSIRPEEWIIDSVRALPQQVHGCILASKNTAVNGVRIAAYVLLVILSSLVPIQTQRGHDAQDAGGALHQ